MVLGSSHETDRLSCKDCNHIHYLLAVLLSATGRATGRLAPTEHSPGLPVTHHSRHSGHFTQHVCFCTTVSLTPPYRGGQTLVFTGPRSSAKTFRNRSSCRAAVRLAGSRSRGPCTEQGALDYCRTRPGIPVAPRAGVVGPVLDSQDKAGLRS